MRAPAAPAPTSAGGATLAQRLARKGWKVLVLEAGPLWDPDEDWVSDEAGAHSLYWTEERIIGGDEAGRCCTGVTYCHDGEEGFQAAEAITVAGYSIETPRLLLHSTSSASARPLESRA